VSDFNLQFGGGLFAFHSPKWWEYRLLDIKPGSSEWPLSPRGWATLVWNMDVFAWGRVPVLKLAILLSLVAGLLGGVAAFLLLHAIAG
jgi:hypothetical protein